MNDELKQAITVWKDGCWKLWGEADANYAGNDPDWLCNILASEIDACRAAPPVPVSRAAWQPIETAPKDGTAIDLWVDGEFSHRRPGCFWGLPHHCCGEMGSYCDSEWHDLEPGWVDDFNEPLSELDRKPTHWMPLPAAPGIQSAPLTNEGGGEYKGMLEDAVRDLAAISAALGIPDDEAGGAGPILCAIEELRNESGKGDGVVSASALQAQPEDWRETAKMALRALNEVTSVFNVTFVDGVRRKLEAVIAAPAPSASPAVLTDEGAMRVALRIMANLDDRKGVLDGVDEDTRADIADEIAVAILAASPAAPAPSASPAKEDDNG